MREGGDQGKQTRGPEMLAGLLTADWWLRARDAEPHSFIHSFIRLANTASACGKELGIQGFLTSALILTEFALVGNAQRRHPADGGNGWMCKTCGKRGKGSDF